MHILAETLTLVKPIYFLIGNVNESAQIRTLDLEYQLEHLIYSSLTHSATTARLCKLFIPHLSPTKKSWYMARLELRSPEHRKFNEARN